MRVGAAVPWGRALLVAVALLGACAPSVSGPQDASVEDAARVTSDAGAAPDESAALRDGGGAEGGGSDAGDGVCASTFGSALTASFGRIDATVRAIVRPGVDGCGPVNGTHLVLQLDLQGATYRAVINVESSRGDDRRVRMRTVSHALPAPAFSLGWHPGVEVDYVALLGTHTADFTPYAASDLVTEVLRNVRVGDRVAVYATSGEGRPDSVHLVHRNGSNHDGALVLAPESASPTWVLFHFADQMF